MSVQQLQSTLCFSTLLLSLEGNKTQRRTGFSHVLPVPFPFQMSGGRELAQVWWGEKDPGQQTPTGACLQPASSSWFLFPIPYFVGRHWAFRFSKLSWFSVSPNDLLLLPVLTLSSQVTNWTCCLLAYFWHDLNVSGSHICPAQTLAGPVSTILVWNLGQFLH